MPVLIERQNILREAPVKSQWFKRIKVGNHGIKIAHTTASNIMPITRLILGFGLIAKAIGRNLGFDKLTSSSVTRANLSSTSEADGSSFSCAIIRSLTLAWTAPASLTMPK